MLYSFKTTVWKGTQIFIFGGVGAVISYLTSLPPTETIIATTIILRMVQNFLKNYDG